MRRHFTALLLSSLAASLIASSAAAQSARDTAVQVTIERLTPVYRSPSLAAETLVMAPPGQFSMRELEIQNGFIRVPLQSIKASDPAIAGRIRALVAAGDQAGWITGAEVSARVVRVRVDTVAVTRADTVLRTRVDSTTVNAHPRDHRE
jgi:hypothetical protein